MIGPNVNKARGNLNTQLMRFVFKNFTSKQKGVMGTGQYVITSENKI